MSVSETNETPEQQEAEAEQVEAGHRFHIQCDCGTELAGERAEGEAQRIICTQCQRPWLVMPRRQDELPVDEAPKQRLRTAFLWFRRKRRHLQRSTSQFLKRAGRRVARSPWVRPQRIALVAVAAIVILTLYIQVASQWQTDWAEELKDRWEQGRAALGEGDLLEARKHLDRAVELLDLLETPHPEADEIRSLSGQVVMLDDLLPVRLETLAAEAHDAGSGDWIGTFDSQYRGRTVLLQGTVTPSIGAGGQTRYVLQFMAIDPRGRMLMVDATDLDVLKSLAPPEPREVVVLARLQSAQYRAGGNPRWTVRLDPGSGVLATSADAVRAARGELPPKVETLIESQPHPEGP